jgi:peptidoglycan/LPS O-acetylase OafA/YrhL
VTKRKMADLEFWTLRMLRIGIPLGGALIFGYVMNIRENSIWSAPNAFGVPTWSLWCEIFYYIAYPIFNRMIERLGVDRLLFVSYVAAFFVFIQTQQWSNPFFFYSGGRCFWLTAVLGLPFWLSGVRLAVKYDARKKAGTRLGGNIWLFRGLIYITQASAALLAFRGWIGAPLGLFMAMPLWIRWIEREMDHYAQRREVVIWKLLGAMSFSIYLTHLSLYKWGICITGQSMPGAIRWLLSFSVIVLGAFAFHKAIEAPSYHFAKWASRKWRGKGILAPERSPVYAFEKLREEG